MTVEQAIEILPTLKKLTKIKQKSARCKILKSCPCNVLNVIKEIAKKTLKGHIYLSPRQKRRLKKYKKEIREISGNIPGKKVRRVLVQKGGLLPGLLVPAISILANLVANQIVK